MEVLDVAEAMTALAARSAADRYTGQLHEALFADVLKRLDLGAAGREEGVFNAARRHFYRVLLQIGENRELRRLFPSVGMHIIHVQYSAPELQKVRHRDYAEIRSEEHTSELQSLMRISYAVFCLKKTKKYIYKHTS